MLAPAETTLATEWRPLAGLAAIADDWRALCARAAEPNVFYEPAFARAAAPVFGADVGVVLVWSQAPRRLLGLFPLRRARRRYGLPFPLLVGWTHPYAPLGTPLVDRDTIPPTLAAMLDHVTSSDALPPRLLLSYVTDDGPVARALDGVLAQRGGVQSLLGRHERALLLPRGDGAEPEIGKRKRKELARQRRRLAELGTLAFERVDPADTARALDDFLVLEAAGWKGAARTAALNDTAVHRFVSEAVAGLAAEGKASVIRLLLAGRPIACGLTLTSGTGGWFWKIAYDETFARYSPGALLTLDLTHALTGSDLDFVDSCAVADHPMIDHFWRGRRTVSDRLIALSPGPAFALACRLEGLRRRIVGNAKSVRDAIRR